MFTAITPRMIADTGRICRFSRLSVFEYISLNSRCLIWTGVGRKAHLGGLSRSAFLPAEFGRFGAFLAQPLTEDSRDDGQRPGWWHRTGVRH